MTFQNESYLVYRANISTNPVFQYIQRIFPKKKVLYFDALIHQIARHFCYHLSYVRNLLEKYIRAGYLFMQDNKISLNVLSNSIRLKIMKLLSIYPGLHLNFLRKKIDVGPNQLLWHLNVLKDSKLIKEQKFNQFYVYFKPDTSFKLVQASVLYLKSTTRFILEILTEYHTLDQKLISQYTKMARSTTLYNLRILEDTGIVRKKQKKRSLFYSINESFRSIIHSIALNYEYLQKY
ncbi:hypothetical protein NEF87_001066 [Candidatus Lokiarchaeum ossiferum]|uniref:HTH arsR-type domain-containing protein n=1 Tax=Candidatus Lokiarchaeum ossiferum TaxID=2951803 RepID=A0ABY6HMY1_9ARCH|nr:hypothetical protein NEF87_001066 [Candidatus Lokiarchaeum sp. B-35]